MMLIRTLYVFVASSLHFALHLKNDFPANLNLGFIQLS
jgi:hypothetical protein